jgi:hypothetical protein
MNASFFPFHRGLHGDRFFYCFHQLPIGRNWAYWNDTLAQCCPNQAADKAFGSAGLAQLVQVTVVRCPRRAGKPIISYPDYRERGVHVRGNGYLPNPPVARTEHFP